MCISYILVVLVLGTPEVPGEHFLGFSSSWFLSICEVVHLKSCLLNFWCLILKSIIFVFKFSL